MKRGDIVVAAFQGDFGEPRPAVVIQSDLFDELENVVLLPTTTTSRDAPLIRIAIGPGHGTGLHARSQIMIDKPLTLPRSKVGQVVGLVDDATMISITRALATLLGFV